MVIDLQVSNDLKNLAKLFKKAPLYIVGGFVRNKLMKIRGSDIDLASALTSEELCKLLENTEYTLKEKSKKLSTYLITSPSGENYEYATFRKETYDNNGKHMPASVEFTTDIREDASRRDFTINAIYYNILTNEIIDIYSGVYDIKKKVIRCIETPEVVFQHDGDRILRMIRFAVELNFHIDRTTFVMAKKMSYRLKDISGTRKESELSKILAPYPKYSVGNVNNYKKALKMFNYFQLWPHFYIPIGKVRYRMVNRVEPSYRFLGLLVDIIDSLNPDCVEYYLQYLLGSDALNFSNKKANFYINVICGYFDALNQVSNKKYFSKYYDNYVHIGELLSKRSKSLHIKYLFFYKYIINHNIPVSVSNLKITAGDLKKFLPNLPEKKYKKVLDDLLSKVYEGEVENNKEKLLKEVKENASRGVY